MRNWQWETRWICACGHGETAHVVPEAEHLPVYCQGPMKQRMRRGLAIKENAAEDARCRCAELRPVVVVPDTRFFVQSAAAAVPGHPFNRAMDRACEVRELDSWEEFAILWKDARRCEAVDPGTGARCPVVDDTVRMAYIDERRTRSRWACALHRAARSRREALMDQALESTDG